MAVALAAPAVKLATAVALPYIMKLIGSKALPALATKTMSKAVVPAVAGGIAQTVLKPTVASSLIGGLGKGLSAAGSIGSMAMPLVMMGAGRVAQGAATAGGAGIEALSHMPASFSQSPIAKQELYGRTPAEAASNIIAGLGGAAGLGVSGIGNALGSTIGDISNSMRMAQLRDQLDARDLLRLQSLQNMNITPSTASVFNRMGINMGGTR